MKGEPSSEFPLPAYPLQTNFVTNDDTFYLFFLPQYHLLSSAKRPLLPFLFPHWGDVCSWSLGHPRWLFTFFMSHPCVYEAYTQMNVSIFLILICALLQGVSAKNSESRGKMIFPPLKHQQGQDLVVPLAQRPAQCLECTMCSHRKSMSRMVTSFGLLLSKATDRFLYQE